MVLFCKQKTAYDMRISDWSSDVCSSDLFAEPPDRRLVGRVVAVIETPEPAEAAAVEKLELGLRVRQRVERLQHQHLEHHHRVQRRPAALAAVRSLQRRLQDGPEQVEVDHDRKRVVWGERV